MLFVDLAVPAALPKTRPGGLKPDAATMPFPFVCVWSTGACRSFRAARPTAATRDLGDAFAFLRSECRRG
jgi:hypothetical protein